MTESQLMKADKYVLNISIIIIINIFLAMLGLLFTDSEPTKAIVEMVICVVGIMVDVFAYRKLRGTKQCGVVEKNYFTGSMINDLYNMTYVRAKEKGLFYSR